MRGFASDVHHIQNSTQLPELALSMDNLEVVSLGDKGDQERMLSQKRLARQGKGHKDLHSPDGMEDVSATVCFWALVESEEGLDQISFNEV